jgi:hypothetical protein
MEDLIIEIENHYQDSTFHQQKIGFGLWTNLSESKQIELNHKIPTFSEKINHSCSFDFFN